tara:strand:+ start:191 stop:355 length:165 start_codon:yes stop_codon:yes gene_type:complete
MDITEIRKEIKAKTSQILDLKKMSNVVDTKKTIHKLQQEVDELIIKVKDETYKS